jgi:hypothetical protein
VAKHLSDFRVGDTFRIKIQYPAGTSLTGYKHWITLKTSFDAATAALSVETTFGDHTADADNVAYLEATPAQTALIAAGKYVYDVQAKAPNGDIVTLMPPVEDYGDRITVRPQVTTDAT